MDVFTSAIWQKDRLLFTLPCRLAWDILFSLLLLGCWTLLRTGWFDVDLEELWRYRDLIRHVRCKRNFTVMYKQNHLGPLWSS